jgi:hypothetical protein
LVADRGQNASRGATNTDVRSETWNQRNCHRSADDDEQGAEDNFQGWPGILKRSDHNFYNSKEVKSDDSTLDARIFDYKLASEMAERAKKD